MCIRDRLYAICRLPGYTGAFVPAPGFSEYKEALEASKIPVRDIFYRPREDDNGKPVSYTHLYYSKHGALPNASNATAHMFIINPMVGIGESLSNLFSTHPRTEERIAKLKQQAMNPKYKEKALF